MKQYYRIILGKGNEHAKECYEGKFIGTDYGIDQDLTHNLHENWRLFNEKYIPIFLSVNPEKKKVSAGLACAAIWTVSKGLNKGDIVLCPNGLGQYLVGEITSHLGTDRGELLSKNLVEMGFKNIILTTGAPKRSIQNTTWVSKIVGKSFEGAVIRRHQAFF